MIQAHVKYLIAGGGIAAGAAALEIRRRDRDAAILIVGQDAHQPFARPVINDAWLHRRVPPEEIFTLPAHWFAENHVELRTGRRVAHLDVTRHSATFDDGQEVAYDKLLLATGATPRTLHVPGGRLPNVLTLRSLDDADRLRRAIDKGLIEGLVHPRGRGRVTVVGGGLLGVETACSFSTLGLAVDLVVPKAYPLTRLAGETLGQFLTHWLQSHHVTVHTGASPLRIDGDGRAQRVVLDAEHTLPCDFVLTAVGVQANKDLLRSTSIAAENHILVDAHARTSAPDVYAAGDCSAIYDPRFGKHRLLDHTPATQEMARIAAINMTGGDESWNDVGHVTMDLFGLTLHSWGEPRLVDRRIVRGSVSGGSPHFAEIGVARDGRVTHVISVGSDPSNLNLRKLVEDRTNIAGHEDRLRDETMLIEIPR